MNTGKNNQTGCSCGSNSKDNFNGDVKSNVVGTLISSAVLAIIAGIFGGGGK